MTDPRIQQRCKFFSNNSIKHKTVVILILLFPFLVKAEAFKTQDSIRSYWDIGLFYAPGFSFSNYAVSPFTTNSFSSSIEEVSPMYSYQAGMRARKVWDNGLGLDLGLTMSRYGTRVITDYMDYNYDSPYVSSPGYSNYFRSIDYGMLLIGVSYRYNIFEKLTAGVSFGSSFGIRSIERERAEHVNQETGEIIKHLEFDSPFYQKHPWSQTGYNNGIFWALNYQLNIQYKIFERTSVSFSPTFNHLFGEIRSFKKNGFVLQGRYSLVGQIGVHWKLGVK